MADAARRFRHVTLFATKHSVTEANLVAFIDKGYEEDKARAPLVSTCLPFIQTPMLTTIHGFSEPDILRVYRDHKDSYYVSIRDSDRDPQLPYVATVCNGIDLTNLTFREEPGDADCCRTRKKHRPLRKFY